MRTGRAFCEKGAGEDRIGCNSRLLPSHGCLPCSVRRIEKIIEHRSSKRKDGYRVRPFANVLRATGYTPYRASFGRIDVCSNVTGSRRRDGPALLGPSKLTAAGSNNPAVAGSDYPARCCNSGVGCRSRSPNSTSLSGRGHNQARTAQRRNLPT